MLVTCCLTSAFLVVSTCLTVVVATADSTTPVIAAPAQGLLPLGQVRPQGWLREQLARQAAGLTGHAEELYEDIGRSDWLTGAGIGKEFAWERGPYYAKGLVSLAFVLDDSGLKAKSKRWIEAILSSQRANGDFGPKERNWWANMIALWTLRDWCEATGDGRVMPFLERYFAFQREAFRNYPLAAESKWAVARAGDELDVVLWLWRKTGKDEWRDFARSIAGQSADWTTYYYRGGDPAGPNANGCRSHIVNFMQGLKTPALQYLLDGDPKKRGAYAAAFDPKGWAMRQCGRPDRMINGSEPMSDRSASQGTELCAIAERILSCQTVIAATGDLTAADDLEIVAYNALPATLGDDGKGMRYYCLLNQPSCEDKYLCFANNGGRDGIRERNGAICPGPHSGFGCCRSNFHFAWPKFVQSMWMRGKNGLVAVAYGPCRLETTIDGRRFVLAEETDYPFDGRIKLTVIEGEGRFAIACRVPSWCPVADSGQLRVFERDWKAGDSVTLDFPMPVKTSQWESHALAVSRGPLLFSFRPQSETTAIETYRVPFEARIVTDRGFPRREIRPIEPWDYALLLDENGSLPMCEEVGAGRELRLRVKAVRTDFGGWGHMRDVTTGRAVDPPFSPLPDEGGRESLIDLVPMGLSQVRITLFPWVRRKGARDQKAYRNDGLVGFSSQRWENDVNGMNIENLIGL